MGKRHNPMDPRDPFSPAFYYIFIDKGRNGGQGMPGCGCWLILLFAFVIAVLLSLIAGH
jgi:hypothetical protein